MMSWISNGPGSGRGFWVKVVTGIENHDYFMKMKDLAEGKPARSFSILSALVC
jgi:hypothetical protein